MIRSHVGEVEFAARLEPRGDVARLCHCLVAVLLEPIAGAPADVTIGDAHRSAPAFAIASRKPGCSSSAVRAERPRRSRVPSLLIQYRVRPVPSATMKRSNGSYLVARPVRTRPAATANARSDGVWREKLISS